MEVGEHKPVGEPLFHDIPSPGVPEAALERTVVDGCSSRRGSFSSGFLPPCRRGEESRGPLRLSLVSGGLLRGPAWRTGFLGENDADACDTPNDEAAVTAAGGVQKKKKVRATCAR